MNDDPHVQGDSPPGSFAARTGRRTERRPTRLARAARRTGRDHPGMQHVIQPVSGIACRSGGSPLAQSPHHERIAIRDRLPTHPPAAAHLVLPCPLPSRPGPGSSAEARARRRERSSRVIGRLAFKHRSNHTGPTTWKSIRKHPLVRGAIPISRSHRQLGCKHVSARLRIRKLWLLLSIKEEAMTPIISFLFGSCAHDKCVPHHVRSDK